MEKDKIYKLKTFTVSLKIRERRRSKERVRTAKESVAILDAIYKELDADQEHFVVLFLDSGNRVRGYKVLFSGGTSQSLVGVDIVFKSALLFGAQGIIIAHNHPSGSLDPSKEDKDVTVRIKKAGDIIGIRLLDHIILSDQGFYSFAREDNL